MYACVLARKLDCAFHEIDDPNVAFESIMKIINEKRDKLGINKKIERKLLSMEDRRKAHV